MSNVMSLKQLRNHTHRNGFDLSRRNAFTAKVGELLPVLCEEVIPGDKFKIKPEWFTRTRPLNTAAYTRVREYYDFYFVPYRLLWKGFDNFITQMDNPNRASSLISSASNPTTVPHFTAMALVEYLTQLKTWCEKATNGNADAYNEVGLNRFYSTVKLLNYLNYGSMERILSDYAEDQSKMPNMDLSAFPLLAYQKIYQDMYRESQWEKAAPYTWNVDYLGLSPVPPILDIDSLPEQWSSAPGPMSSFHSNLLDMRFCNWNKDLFFGLLPSPQFGSEAFAPIKLAGSVTTSIGAANTFSSYTAAENTEVNWTQRSGRAGFLTLGEDNGNYIAHNHTAQSQLNLYSNTGLSVLALRQAEALQKWKEISLSGSQDFRTQMQKHWGVDVGANRSDRCQYVGGCVNNVSIGEVINNNITSDNIADIAGKGTGSGNGSVDFESKDYGVFMCVYHAVPLLDYESVGIKRFNTKLTATDFAIPEFDSVGMQTVMNYQLVFGKPVNITPTGQEIYSLGYAPRYIEYKTAVDEVHGGFMSMPKAYIEQQGFPAWVAPLNYSFLSKFTTKSDLTRKGEFTYTDFKIKPTVLDPIFSGTIGQEQEDGSVKYDNSLATDQLLCNAFFDFKAVRNLDYNGLPY